MYNKIKSFFNKKEEPPMKKERAIKELIRENLALVPLDIYYVDDPLLDVPPDRRSEYLKKFSHLIADKDVMERFKYLINKQVRLTMQLSKDSSDNTNGALNINGMATVKDDFERLANMYVKENIPTEDFNKFNII